MTFVRYRSQWTRKGNLDLPAVAFEQTWAYTGWRWLWLAFYGGLLLITPVFSGLVMDACRSKSRRRGAKFAEEADQSSERAEAAIRNLEETVEGLSEDLATALFKIEKLEQRPARDNTYLKVDSKP